jgi:hypothetical protein
MFPTLAVQGVHTAAVADIPTPLTPYPLQLDLRRVQRCVMVPQCHADLLSESQSGFIPQ